MGNKVVLAKWMILVTAFALLCGLSAPRVFATTDYRAPLQEQIALPADLNFSVSDTCSGHSCYEQAAANEAGDFAVACLLVDAQSPGNSEFSQHYVDIYHADGSFWAELSFHTSLGPKMFMDDHALYIYFGISALVYDLQTQELTHYTISAEAAENMDLQGTWPASEFTAGKWTYRCEKGHMFFDKLTRTDGAIEQVLVQMEGTNSLLMKGLPGILIGVAAVIVPGLVVLGALLFHKKRKEAKKED